MNSTIASNINGTIAAEKKDSLNKKIAIGSRASLLNDNINFALTGTKKPSSSTGIPGQFLCKLTITEPHLNGQKKLKSEVDQNRNTFNNSYANLNGNKEKAVEDGIPIPKVQLYSGKIYVEWKHEYKIGAGLTNLGNTCFMNTVIQCLTYCPPLANYLLLDNDHTPRCSTSGFCMMCLLQKHMKKAIGKTGDVIKPLEVYHRLKLIAKHFQHGRQEDAHEFLRYVIDNLWKSCLSQNNNCSKLDPASKETTVINQIFGGYHRSQVTCSRCKEKSNTFDHFMDFILDIKQNVMSLEKALERYTLPEKLDQENSYKCPKCKIKVTANKKFTVYKAPIVATFQFKRFDYNRSFGGKISKHISYPERLNLRPYMSESKGDPVWYRLNAVLVHSGPSCNSGHYYCYVKNSNRNWYIMDDQRVQKVELNTVLSQVAYVLFYIKDTSQGPTFKKCFENRNSVMKGPISAGTYKKIPEMPLKSSPLAERNQAKVSSPTIKPQLCSPANVNKKIPASPNNSSDRISFGIRPSMPTIQDIHKSAELLTPSKKAKPSQTTTKTSNNHSGLVPYMKDSSESSDENESTSRLEDSKAGSASGSSTNLSENANVNASKFSKNVNDGSVKIEIKRKLSKSLLKLSKFSPIITNGSSKISPSLVNSIKARSSTSNSSSTPPKVIATGSWTVTDAPASPSAGSTCSSNSITSTSDWHVTSTKLDSPVETLVNSFADYKSKENGNVPTVKREETATPISDISVYSSPKLASKNSSLSNSQEANGNSSCEDTDDSIYSLSGKKCDFRKQQPQSGKTFLEQGKTSNQNYSFLKRKCSDTDKEVSTISKSDHNEVRSGSVFKKVKYLEECTEFLAKNGIVPKIKTDKDASSESENSKLIEHNSLSKKSKYSESPSKNGFAKVKSEKSVRSESESSKDYRKSREAENVPSAGNSRTDLKHIWVEKTKDSIESSHQSPVKEHPWKNSHHSSSENMSFKAERKDVVSELTKNSQYFYGSSVPTWKGESHYKDTQPFNEKKKFYDDYEDEFDRGKTRKFRPKDRHQPYYNNRNPFQKYGERTFQPKYNGHFNHGHHKYHNKPYDSHSHHKWRQNHNNDHRHRNHYRPNFRR